MVDSSVDFRINHFNDYWCDNAAREINGIFQYVHSLHGIPIILNTTKYST